MVVDLKSNYFFLRGGGFKIRIQFDKFDLWLKIVGSKIEIIG